MADKKEGGSCYKSTTIKPIFASKLFKCRSHDRSYFKLSFSYNLHKNITLTTSTSACSRNSAARFTNNCVPVVYYFHTENHPSKRLVSNPFTEKGIKFKFDLNYLPRVWAFWIHDPLWDFSFKKRTLMVCWFTYCYILTNPTAPEILNGKPYSYEVDWWSLGVVMYTLLVGKVSATEDSVISVIADKECNDLDMFLLSSHPI